MTWISKISFRGTKICWRVSLWSQGCKSICIFCTDCCFAWEWGLLSCVEDVLAKRLWRVGKALLCLWFSMFLQLLPSWAFSFYYCHMHLLKRESMAIGWEASFWSDVLIYSLQHFFPCVISQLHLFPYIPFSSFTLQTKPSSIPDEEFLLPPDWFI